MACAPSEDSDQPGHPPSLIRVFAVRMKKDWDLSYPLSAQRMPRLIRGFAGRTCHFVGFVTRRLKLFAVSLPIHFKQPHPKRFWHFCIIISPAVGACVCVCGGGGGSDFYLLHRLRLFSGGGGQKKFEIY